MSPAPDEVWSFDLPGFSLFLESFRLGIGKSLALRLAQLGAHVIAVSKSDENLKQLVAEVILSDAFE